MATINRICGFETGDETELVPGSGGSVSASNPRSGSYSLFISGAVASIDPFGAQVADAGNDYITSLAVRFLDTTPAAAADFLICSDGSGANHVRLRLETSGDLTIIDANDADIRTITTPFTDVTYAFLELHWQRSATGTVELFIEGASQGTDSSQDLLSGTADFTSVDFDIPGAASVNIDDFYQISGATSSADRLSNGAADPFFEVFGYQSDKASATPDDGGANLQVGQWVDCGVVPFSESTVAEYTDAGAGAVDSDGTNGNPEGPLNDSRITGTIACIQGVWLMNRSGGQGSDHFGLLGNDTDGTTRSADFSPGTPILGKFFLSESASIVPETDEYCRIGFETTGAQDFQCYGQMAMLAHIPAGGADHTGTGGTTSPAQTADGDGDNINNGTGTPDNPAQVASGSGLVTVSGTGTPSNPAQEAAGTATVTYSGTGGTTSPAQLSSGSGITNANMGSGGTTSPAQLASGSAKVTYSGTGTPSNPAQLATGTAKVTYSGTGTPSNPAQEAAGTGTAEEPNEGTGGTTSPAQTASGAGDNVNNGTGAPENPAQIASGSGDNINNGTGGTISPVQEASGSGDIIYSGTGGTTSPAQTASGSGTGGANVGTGTPENPAQVSSGSGTVTQFIPAGEETFLEDGTFTPEAGVTEVSVLSIGGGGGGSANDAAGGGGLAWKNNISVTAGHSVIVGAAGVGGGRNAGTDGGDSTFEGVTGGGGTAGADSGNGGDPSGPGGAPSGEDGGGSGGDGLRHGGTENSGGGGAGGYTGDGGDGVLTSAGLPGAGGGSGSGGSTDDIGSGGGGTGIFGAGSNGAAGSSAPTGGGGGSDGEDGTTGTFEVGGVGGDFGGGGGTGATSVKVGGDGGAGVVRIIWGTGRSFPNNAGPLISGTGGTVSPAQTASGSGKVTYSGSGGTTAPAQRATNLQHLIGTGGTTAPAQTAQGNDSPRSFAFSTTIMDTIAENSTVMDSSETLIAESSTVMDKIAGTSTIMAKV